MTWYLLVGWESNVDDGSVLTESLTNGVLVSIERKVTEEESVGRRVLGISKGSSTVVGALFWCSVVAGGREVNVGLTTVNESTLLGLQGSGGVSRVLELDVSETLGASTLSVGDDTGASDGTKLLEFLEQPLVVNVPAQVTNEQVLGSSVLSSSWGSSLGLLCGWLAVLFGLALLGWCGLSLLAVTVGSG